MPSAELLGFIGKTSGHTWRWVAKILSANDTGLTGSHQAGVYLSREVVFATLPSIAATMNGGGDIAKSRMTTTVQEGDAFETDVTWYKSKTEGRITRWRGSRAGRIRDESSTGRVLVLAFNQPDPGRDAVECRTFVSTSEEDDTEIEDRVGPVEPGEFPARPPLPPVEPDPKAEKTKETDCHLKPEEIPADWLKAFPSGDVLASAAIARRLAKNRTPDALLIARRNCEYELFQSIERAYWEPRVTAGFRSIEEFVDAANRMLNARKSRSGRSLENHAAVILHAHGKTFERGARTELGKVVDFLFPSAAAYAALVAGDRPPRGMALLAAKTSLRDRWRQVADEAEKLPQKFILTLQPGVSESQMNQMSARGIRLVVPKKLHRRYPKVVRPRLLSFGAFMRLV